MWRVASLVGCAFFALGCSGDAVGAPDGGDGGVDTGTPDGSLPDAGADTGAPDADAAVNRCSNDLRNVLDANGNVVLTCPPQQGCANGVCVAPCDAAAASLGTLGCDYLIPTPSFYPTIKPPCFAVFVANGWPTDAKLTVSYAGTSYDATTFGRIPVAGMPESSWSAIPQSGIPAGQAAVLFLSDDPSSVNGTSLACPVAPALSQAGGTALPGSGTVQNVTGRGTGWHLASDVPITAYDILPYGGAKSYLPSAEVLFPTTAWGVSYIGVLPPKGTQIFPQWGQLIALSDNTTVTVTPTVSLPAGTNVVAAPQGQKTTFTLSAGELIQWQDSGEMSGTSFVANHPISFTGGNTYNCYKSATSTGGGCDSAHQQIPPLSAFGSEYVSTPYTTRLQSDQPESIVYRLVGAVDGTTLTYSPSVAGAPTTINARQVIDFETTATFVVKSQGNTHPFYLGETMSGGTLVGASKSPQLGDEEFVNVLPPSQYLTKYVFFTDPAYGTTNLVFVRVKTSKGLADVTLDCAGKLSGWTPVGNGDYEITNVDLIRNAVKVGGCNNGVHTAESTGPFGLMVWGLDSYASYAYPAGGNLAPVNTIQ